MDFHILVGNQKNKNRPIACLTDNLRLSGIFGLENAVPTEISRPAGENDPTFRPTLEYEWLCPWASAVCERANGICLIRRKSLQKCIEAYACNRVRKPGTKYKPFRKEKEAPFRRRFDLGLTFVPKRL